MTIKKLMAVALIAATFGPGSAVAQNSSSLQAPAEFPPASYTGRQYVDSNGCVFVRAGIDGNVTWVPRVSRNRKVICGFQPSIPGGAGTTQIAAKPAVEPVQITVSEPATQPATRPAAQPAVKVAPAPAKPAPKIVVAQPKPVVTQPVAAPKPVLIQVPRAAQPQPVATITPVQPTVKPVPKTVTIASAAPMPKPEKMAPRQSACRGASPISAQYMTSTRGLPVRCGPQSTPHVTLGPSGQTGVQAVAVHSVAVSPTAYAQPVPLKRANPVMVPAGQARIVPKSVYENQIASTYGVYIPEGYKAVWTDDRLNPKRAHQTAQGQAQMQLIWTNTVPRRLIDAKTGADMHHRYPGLMYPNTSYDQQIIAGVSVSAGGQVSKAAPSVTRSANKTRESIEAKPRKAEPATHARSQTQPRATVSTRSATVKPAAAPSHRYVQAGSFGDMANARKAAQRIANAGLPAKLGKRTRGGKVYGVVVTGPFATQGQVQAALSKVRNMGYGDAFLRN